MKHHIIVSPETNNLIIASLEYKLGMLTDENTDLKKALEDAKKDKEFQDKALADATSLNEDLTRENVAVIEELKDANKKIEEADIDTMVSKISILEGKLDNFGEVKAQELDKKDAEISDLKKELEDLKKDSAKERIDLHNLIKGIFIDLHKGWSEEVSKLLEEKEYYLAASKIAQELKTEPKKKGAGRPKTK